MRDITTGRSMPLALLLLNTLISKASCELQASTHVRAWTNYGRR
jgi:hypothetical protein